MTTDQIVYTVFGVVILVALTLDLGFLEHNDVYGPIRFDPAGQSALILGEG